VVEVSLGIEAGVSHLVEDLVLKECCNLQDQVNIGLSLLYNTVPLCTLAGNIKMVTSPMMGYYIDSTRPIILCLEL
jgi:hypothetical protein